MSHTRPFRSTQVSEEEFKKHNYNPCPALPGGRMGRVGEGKREGQAPGDGQAGTPGFTSSSWVSARSGPSAAPAALSLALSLLCGDAVQAHRARPGSEMKRFWANCTPSPSQHTSTARSTRKQLSPQLPGSVRKLSHLVYGLLTSHVKVMSGSNAQFPL